MSHQATTWVMSFSESRLSNRLVMLAIAHRISNDDGEAFPSIATIAKESRISEASVHDALNSLSELGELEVYYGEGPRGTNVYRFPLFLTWWHRVQSLDPPYRILPEGVQNPARGGPKSGPKPSLREPSLREPSELSGVFITSDPSERPCNDCGAVGKHHCPGRQRKPKRREWRSREPKREPVVQQPARLSLGEQNRLAALRAVQQVSKP